MPWHRPRTAPPQTELLTVLDGTADIYDRMQHARLPLKCTSAPMLASSDALMIVTGPMLSGPRGSLRACPRAVSTSASVVSTAPAPEVPHTVLFLHSPLPRKTSTLGSVAYGPAPGR